MFSQAADEILEVALNEALETGYRHIDTAAAYFNEQVIGKVLHEWISSGKVTREELFITTKVNYDRTKEAILSSNTY